MRNVFFGRIKPKPRNADDEVVCALWKCTYRQKGELKRRIALFNAESKDVVKIMCRGWAASHGFKFVRVVPLVRKKDIPKELYAQTQADDNNQQCPAGPQ